MNRRDFQKGCFLVNSALEVAPHQRQLGAIIAKQFGEIEAFFRRRILAAQAEGAAPRGIDAYGAPIPRSTSRHPRSGPLRSGPRAT
jgi:hypothetical protein